MKNLPPLDNATHVRISRQGGVAYLPGLVRARRIDLTSCPEDERQYICRVVKMSAGLASDDCARGDQRYFRIEIVFGEEQSSPTMSFQVAEPDAPEPLQQLWRTTVGRTPPSN